MLTSKSKQYLTNRYICIIGFMGSGKNYFGNILADLLNAKIIDTDELIVESEKKTIIEIFKEKGEEYFRKKEKEILENIVYKTPSPNTTTVIITGGGLPIKRNNQKLLKQLNPIIILLSPPFDTIFERIKGTKRPLIYRRSRQAIFNLYALRYRIYSKLANITLVDTDINEIFNSLNLRISISNQF